MNKYVNVIVTQVNPKDLRLNQALDESRSLCKASFIKDKLMEVKKLILTMSEQNFNVYVNDLYEEDFVVSGNNLIVRHTALCFLDSNFLVEGLLSNLNLLRPKYTMTA